MKITFLSNYLNHHQLSICEEFLKFKDIDFIFVATEKISDERLQLGYEDMNKKYSFVLRTYDSSLNMKKALNLALESDLVIIGSAPDIFIKERLNFKDKITFKYSERIFKSRSIKNLFSPLKGLRVLKNYFKDNKYYLLSASAYASKDFNIIGFFKNKCFKWGYFPKVNKYKIQNIIDNKNNDKVLILWVGRFIKYKHPEYAINLAEYLNKKKCNNYLIKMVGTGKEFEKYKKIINEKGLYKNILLTGPQKNNEVINEMKKANIFIFTSDRGEGWGAVLNEAMSCGCCVVANKKIGSAPFLIENGQNGYMYDNKKDFLKKVSILINDKNKREKFSINAYNTMLYKWNPKTAVNNLLDLYKKIKNNQEVNKIDYNGGPCSFDKRY